MLYLYNNLPGRTLEVVEILLKWSFRKLDIANSQ